MANERETVEAFEALIEELLSLGATDLVRDIHATVAQGTTRQGKGKKREKITVRAPYTPGEAFGIAVRHVLAALDPVFMVREASVLLEKLEPGATGEPLALAWRFDTLLAQEGVSALLPDAAEYVEPIRPLPDLEIEEYHALKAETAKVSALCDRFLAEPE